jgi:hypothetical protein
VALVGAIFAPLNLTDGCFGTIGRIASVIGFLAALFMAGIEVFFIIKSSLGFQGIGVGFWLTIVGMVVLLGVSFGCYRGCFGELEQAPEGEAEEGQGQYTPEQIERLRAIQQYREAQMAQQQQLQLQQQQEQEKAKSRSCC